MTIQEEIARYEAVTRAMPNGEAKAVRMCAISDARHFVRQEQDDRARRTLTVAAGRAKQLSIDPS